MNILNYSSALPPFSNTELALWLEKIPNTYNRLGELGIFNPVPISKVDFSAEELVGSLNMLDSIPRDGVAPKNTADKRNIRPFVVPHMALDDVVLAGDAQGVRALGSMSDETTAAVTLRKLASMKAKFDITREYRRMGAIKGIILNPSQTTIYNLYTEYGVVAKTIDFELDVDTTDVNSKCREVKRYIEDNQKGEVVSGLHCFVSQEFYDALVKHPSVKEAFKYFLTQQQLGGDYRGRFLFGGIVFEEYRATCPDQNGVERRFIAANKGHVVPLGARCFAEVIAPGTFMECVNTMGQPYYAKMEPRKFNTGFDLTAQSSILPFCARPEILVEVSI